MKMRVVQSALEQALQTLAPIHMELLNESHMHAVPPNSESHFKLVIVSQEFDGLNAVKRHQTVYRTLGDLMQQIHALALHTYSPAEWQARNGAPDSPDCMGGSKADH
ncbi:MAG: BolA family protein [Pseudomonas sp.]